MLAQPAEPPQHVRHVAAEHPPQGVQLVDDDVAQPQEERRPARVRRQDPHVEHLGVGEDDVGVVADPRPLVERGVAVVRRGHEVGDQPLAEGAQLVLGEGLGGEDQQRSVAATAGDRLDDRHLVAERLARSRPGRDRDVAPVTERVDGIGLVRPQRVDAPAAQAGVDEGREGGLRTGGTGGARREHLVADDPVEVLVREGAERGAGVGLTTRRRLRDRANGSGAPRRRRSRRATSRRRRS